MIDVNVELEFDRNLSPEEIDRIYATQRRLLGNKAYVEINQTPGNSRRYSLRLIVKD